MLALQAQDLTAAKWAVGLRSPASTNADLEDALQAGSVVRSWPLRGTLHLVAAEDLRWILALTSERFQLRDAGRLKALELMQSDIERSRDAAIGELSEGTVLSRAQLLAVFERAGLSIQGQRGYHLLWHLAVSGTICFGPPRERTQTFVLFEEWISESRILEHEEALGELALRFFRSRGPATLKDFAWWSSLTMTEAGTRLAVARGALAEEVLDERTYYVSQESQASQESQDAGARSGGGVHILPGFDEYVLGYQDRSAALASEHRHRIVPGNNGMFLPTIVEDGEIIGTWKHRIVSDGVHVKAAPFTALSAGARAGFNDAARRYARFLGRELMP